jgi:hypothetical protein
MSRMRRMRRSSLLEMPVRGVGCGGSPPGGWMTSKEETSAALLQVVQTVAGAHEFANRL